MKNILIVVAVCVIGLVGCEQGPTQPINKEFERTNIELEVIVLRSEREIAEHFAEWMDAEPANRMKGYSVWSAEGNKCRIVIVEPRNTSDSFRIESIGHEVMHCMYGAWHDDSLMMEAVRR